MAQESSPTGVDSRSRNWAMAAHLMAFVTFLVPIPGANILGPLVVWLVFRHDLPFVDFHGKEAINFNISFLIWTVAAVIVGLLALGIGWIITVPVVLITWFVLVIMAAVKASNGETYRYPFTVRFIT